MIPNLRDLFDFGTRDLGWPAWVVAGVLLFGGAAFWMRHVAKTADDMYTNLRNQRDRTLKSAREDLEYERQRTALESEARRRAEAELWQTRRELVELKAKVHELEGEG